MIPVAMRVFKTASVELCSTPQGHGCQQAQGPPTAGLLTCAGRASRRRQAADAGRRAVAGRRGGRLHKTAGCLSEDAPGQHKGLARLHLQECNGRGRIVLFLNDACGSEGVQVAS